MSLIRSRRSAELLRDLKPLIIAFGLMIVGQLDATAQVIINQWNFNDYTQTVPVSNAPPPVLATPGPSAPSPLPSIGPLTGVATLVSLAPYPTSGADFFESGGSDPGSPDPIDPINNPTATFVWRTFGYPAQSTGSGTAGVRFASNTAGKNNLFFSFDLRALSRASKWYQPQYTLDGTNFVNYGGPLEAVTSNNFANFSTLSFANVPGAATANFGVRIVSIFAPGTGSYATNSGFYGPAGTSGSQFNAATAQIDMVTFAEANTWTSATSGNLETAANWNTGAPVSGVLSSNLYFGSTASSSVTVTNNTAGFRAQSISFPAGATTSYTIAGSSSNSIRIGTDASGLRGLISIINASSRTQTISAPLFIDRGQTWDVGSAAGGSLVVNGSITFGGPQSTDGLTLTGQNDTTINGAITAFVFGTTITKTGAGTLTLGAASPSSFGVTVSQGTLRVTNSGGATATGTAGVTIAAGTKLTGAQNFTAGTRGFVGGDTTISGTVQPGTTTTTTSGGQVNFTGASQAVTFGSGSKYTWNLADLTNAAGNAGIGYDQVLVENGAGLNLTSGVVELAFSGTTTPTQSNSFWQSLRTWTILQITGINPNATLFNGVPGGISNAGAFASAGTFTLSNGVNGNVVLLFTPVPEPMFALGVGLAIVGLVVRATRRRRSR